MKLKTQTNNDAKCSEYAKIDQLVSYKPTEVHLCSNKLNNKLTLMIRTSTSRNRSKDVISSSQVTQIQLRNILNSEIQALKLTSRPIRTSRYSISNVQLYRHNKQFY